MIGSLTANRLGFELQDPKTQARAVAEIARAFRKTKGNATRAAKELGVSHPALMRWVRTHPALEAAVREIRAEAGVPHEVGSPARRKKPA